MDKTSLTDFITDLFSRDRVTFGDVRKLQRDYFANGIASRADVEVLVQADSRVSRLDRAWTDWLAAAIENFVKDEPRDGAASADMRAWLEGVYAAHGKASKVARKIIRDLPRDLPRDSKPNATIIPFPKAKLRFTVRPIETPTTGHAQEFGLVRRQPVHALLGEWQGVDRCLTGGRLRMMAA